MSEGHQPTTRQADDREVVLVKHGHRYVLRYRVGEEAQALAQLSELAHDPNSDIDWFDAAMLSHQIGVAISHAYGRPATPSTGGNAQTDRHAD